jgi:hypothetical protein
VKKILIIVLVLTALLTASITSAHAYLERMPLLPLPIAQCYQMNAFCCYDLYESPSTSSPFPYDYQWQCYLLNANLNVV